MHQKVPVPSNADMYAQRKTSDSLMGLGCSQNLDMNLYTISANEMSKAITNSSADDMTLTPTGLGIGTNAPYYKLDLRFDNSNTSFSGGSGGDWGGNGVRIENDNSTVGSMALVQFRTSTADWFIGNKFIKCCGIHAIPFFI